MMTAMPSALLRGVLFALLACSLLVNPVAAPAAFFEDDGTAPLEQEAEDEAAARDGIDGEDDGAARTRRTDAGQASGEPLGQLGGEGA